jgi:type I restriction enzyme M protein
LSILGSQGDAGQFRTPRHVIDFIVEAVDPKKDETVLDPACGTAGFLISAYNHILKENGGLNKESSLTPDERARLLKNFTGYDISPEMVRLSLVNMYLHGFVQPRIEEYDTLTYEDHWNEDYDVILANPPFMTPKGGVRPHKRFQIQANRAEVLFVDYIAEHLKPSGRAGIVVPEGIIFQTGSAYKSLRKMLIEEQGLWAVVSLPAGVFQPYSGVKTSVLLLDKNRAKKTNEILFVEVKSDGTALGATRKTIDKNDIPAALAIIRSWRDNKKTESEFGLYVGKDEILKKNYDLSVGKYRNQKEYVGQFNYVPLSEFLVEEKERVKNRDTQVWSVSNTKGFVRDGTQFNHTVASADTSNYKVIKHGFFAYNPSRINVGSIALNLEQSQGAVSPMYVVFSVKNGLIDNEYLFDILKSQIFNTHVLNSARGGVRQQLKFQDLLQIKVPVPDTDKQKDIVRELDNYQKIIDSAKLIISSWEPKLNVNPAWDKVELGSITKEFQYGTSSKSVDSGEVICLRMGNIQSGQIDWKDIKYASPDEDIEKYLLQSNDVLFNRTNSPKLVGKTSIFKGSKKAIFAGYLIRIKYDKTKILGDYLNYCLNSKEAKEFCRLNKTDGVSQSNINAKTLSHFSLPLPSLDEQEKIVEKIEGEKSLISANHQLIKLYKQKSDDVISEIWGS